MKKVLIISLAVAMIVILLACGGQGDTAPTAQTGAPATQFAPELVDEEQAEELEVSADETYDDSTAQYRADIVMAFDTILDSSAHPIALNMFLARAWEIGSEVLADSGLFGCGLNMALNIVAEDESYVALLEQMKDDISAINELVGLIQNPPAAYANAYNYVMDMYVLYIQLTELVLNPSGTPSSFNETLEAKVTEFNALRIRTRAMLPTAE